MAKVSFDNVTKVYDDRSGTVVAVEELDLTIQDGEFFVLVGPSGCGKSTILRMLAGLEIPTEGEIRIGDEVINEKPPKDRDIAMVFQNYALYPHKTVRENMGYGLKLTTNLESEEIRKRVEETASMMGIADLLDKKPGALSGGQQQRVATGRAIVREPSVFLFDEPLSNLDAKLRKHLRTELSRLHNDLGITSFYVTHDQEEAMTMADRIAVINNGQLQQVGNPREIYFSPANRFVADFVGSPSMNFLNVEFRELNDGSGQFILENGESYKLSKQFVENLQSMSDSDEFILGIRPDNIDISDEADAESEKTLELTVDVVEILGSENIIYLELAGEEFRARSNTLIEPEMGDEIDVTFDEDAIHIFDVETEAALIHGTETVEEEKSQGAKMET